MLSRMRSDKTLPQYIFDKNYTVTIPSKDDWGGLNTTDNIVCYTDGSRLQAIGQSGASIYIQTVEQKRVTTW